MRHLARHHEITYLAFAEPDQPAADVTGMREVAARVETDHAHRSRPRARWRFYADAAMHVVDPLPYAVGKYRSAEFRRRFDALARSEVDFDLIVCDFLFPAVNLPKRLPCPAVMFTHNVESEIWRRHAGNEDRARSEAALRHAVSPHAALRRRRAARASTACSRSPTPIARPSIASTRAPFSRPVHVVPTGVDTEYFAPDRSPVSPNPIAIRVDLHRLHGLAAQRRRDAVLLPRRAAAHPRRRAATCSCRSSAARRRRRSSSSPTQAGVTVTGRVDDVRPYMRDAAVYIVPLRIGGGTRLKIFEAMAMGKAVVSTTIGAEGLPVTDGEHVMLADEPHTVRARGRRSCCATSTAGVSSKLPRARSSSSATTGRQCQARSKTALDTHCGLRIAECGFIADSIPIPNKSAIRNPQSAL